MKFAKSIKWLLCLVCLLAALFAFTLAANAMIVDSGTCGAEGDGSNLTWTLDDAGVLTISGTGRMMHFHEDSDLQWKKNAIKRVVIHNGAVNIGDCSFEGCTELTSVDIPNSVEEIGNAAFYGCDKLTSLVIPDGVKVIRTHSFAECEGLQQVTLPDSLTSLGSGAFIDCHALKDVVIPNSVTTIAFYVFLGCENLTEITIPDSVTSLGSYAFSGCTGLKKVTLSKNLDEILYHTFSGCSELTEVTIPDSVTTIGSCAFTRCNKLASITIPYQVTEIKESAFTECDNLRDVYYKGDAEDWNKIVIEQGNESLLNATIHFLGKEPGKTSEEEPVHGDVDGDGKVTSADARLALRASIRLEDIREGTDAFTAADADRNGKLEPEDARYILRASVGLENLATLGRGVDWILENNAEAWQGYRNKALCEAYSAQVERLIAQCGKGRITNTWGNADSLDGVSVVRLIDLDRDGTPELYCGFAESETTKYSNREAVYRFHNGKLETLYEGDMTNYGSDYSPLVWFHEKDGVTYFVAGMCFNRWYFWLENGNFRGIRFGTDYSEYFYVNEKECSEEEFNNIYQQYTKGGTDAVLWIYDYRDNAEEAYNATLKETNAVIEILKNGGK